MTKPNGQKRTRRLQKNARPAGRFTFAPSTNATCRRDYAYSTLEPPFLTRGGLPVPRGCGSTRGRDATCAQDTTRLTKRVRARRRQTRNRLTPFGPSPGGLTRPQGDRGHKLMRAFVARPGVPDATSQIECGFFSDQQNAAAARTFGSAKTMGGGFRSVAGELQGHRRSSATLPHTPFIPMVPSCAASVALPRRDYETLMARRRHFRRK
jgi:hypothetical protein